MNPLIYDYSGLSKVAGCRRKLPSTWSVLTGYSAWHFFTDGIFLKKYPWVGLETSSENYSKCLCATHSLIMPTIGIQLIIHFRFPVILERK